MDMAELAIQKELSEGQDRNCLHRATSNGVWLSTTPHRLNGVEMSWEEFWDNLHLIYGLMPSDIPATCNGCSKNLLIDNALS